MLNRMLVRDSGVVVIIEESLRDCAGLSAPCHCLSISCLCCWVPAVCSWHQQTCIAAVRSVALNLANKFSQCTFSVAEHYDLFSDLIILRQAWWHRSYDVIPHRPHRTDRETAAGKAQRYHINLKLIYMFPIIHYTTRRQFRVHGHFKSVRNNRRRLYKTATPTR